MMKKYPNDKIMIAAIFLIILMILTPNANAYRYLSAINQPRVFSECSTKTMEISGKKIEFKQLSTVTYHANGVIDASISITVENTSEIFPRILINEKPSELKNIPGLIPRFQIIQIDENTSELIPRIQINYSKTISPEETQTSKVSNIQSKTMGGYPGPLQEVPWDGLFSVVAPGNYTYFIKYDHDNNYERYYKFQWNQQWEMEGLEKTHVHLAASDVNAWIAGTLTDEAMMGKIVGGGALATRILGAAAGTAIVFLMHSIPGLIIGIIVAAMAQIFAWLMELFGAPNRAQHLTDNLQLANDDGFIYYWGFTTARAWGLITNPPIFDIYGPNDMHVLLQHHRVEVLMIETREFYEALGAERDTSSPGRYSFDIPYITYLNPGFWGTTDADYGFGWW